MKRKRQKKKALPISEPFLAGIPEDIIIIILTFLPAKTLIRFRCVCKSWFNLISSSKFIKTHLLNSSFPNNFTNQRLILRYIDLHYFLKSCSFQSRTIIGFCNAVQIDYPKKYPYKRLSIVGTCNGLLCIAIQEYGLLIWNLSTRISKEVPVSDINFRIDLSVHEFLITYGFGYDVLNDDYKVVWIVSVLGGVEDEKEVKIYSLKTGSWTKIGDFPLGIPFNDFGKYVNGILHWTVAGTDAFNSSVVIVTVDLGNDSYGEIAQPCYGDRKISSLRLGVLKACLSVFCHFEKNCCDVWMMKEYGVKDTWIKLYTIPYETKHEFSCYSPLCICKSGEILLEFGWHLILYNPSNGKFRNAKIRKLPVSLTGLEAITYVESLVSPSTLV